MKCRTSFLVSALVLLASAPLHSQEPLKCRYFPSDHFVIVCLDKDLNDGLIEAKHLRATSAIFERAYDALVTGPNLKKPFEGKTRTLVMIYDWSEPNRYPNVKNITALGFANLEGTINLKLEHYGKAGEDIPPERLMQVATHEFFHIVQNSYDSKGHGIYRWLREGTADWAVRAAYPALDLKGSENRFFGEEERFLERTHLPIDFYEKGNDSGPAGPGHPYGTSLLFRFLGKHHGGTALLKRITEEFGEEAKLYGKIKYHPLTVVAKSLNKKGPDDPEFREIYDRFAVACALGKNAPVERLPDTVKDRPDGFESQAFGRGSDKIASKWDRHHSTLALLPALAIYSVAGGIKTVSNDPLAAFAGNLLNNAADDVTIGRGGFRCFTIVQPHERGETKTNLPPDSTLLIEVQAATDALSVQGLIRDTPDGPVRIVKAGYDPGNKRYLLRVPKFETIAAYSGAANAPGSMLLVVTRYSGETDTMDPFPVYITLAEPPVVKEVRVIQGDKIKQLIHWAEKRDDQGVLFARVKAFPVKEKLDDAVDAKLEFDVSAPIAAPKDKPLASIDDFTLEMTSKNDGLTWSGTIPAKYLKGPEHSIRIRGEASPKGARFKLPIDENPATVARPLGANWQDYDRSENGMVVDIGQTESPKSPIKISLLFPPEGAIEEHLRIQSPLFQELKKKPNSRINAAIFGAITADGPFKRQVTSVTIKASTTSKLNRDGTGNAWVDDETYQASFSPSEIRVLRDADGKITGSHKGPIWYQVRFTYFTGEPMDRGTPAGESNVVGPEAAIIRVLSESKDGRYKLDPRSNGYNLPLAVRLGYIGNGTEPIRFKVAFAGQTRYALMPAGSISTSLALPFLAPPFPDVSITAEMGGKAYQGTASFINDPKDEEAFRTAGMKFADQIATNRAKRTADEPANATRFQQVLKDQQEKLETLKANPKSKPEDIERATQDVARAMNSSKIAPVNEELKRCMEDRDLALAKRDFARVVQGYQKELEIRERLKPLALIAFGPSSARDYDEDMQFEIQSKIANAAHDMGDLQAFRTAILAISNLRPKLQLKDPKTVALSTASDKKRLADAIVLFTGETTEAKQLVLQAKGLYEQFTKLVAEGLTVGQIPLLPGFS
ncbi:MAG: hypothetical protein K8T89_04200 [Planctomycetes bacterium]|nr:hypothetical protein [Planctomycetota bacterium]